MPSIKRQGLFPFNGAWFALPNGKELHLVQNKLDAKRNKINILNSVNGIWEYDEDGNKIPNRHFALRVKTLDIYNNLYDLAGNYTKAIEKLVIRDLNSFMSETPTITLSKSHI